MNPHIENLTLQTRRHFLQQSQLGFGAIALSALLGNTAAAAKPDAALDAVINPLAPKSAPLPAKAKRVIYLHLTGSPPHLDLYDYKPELVKHTDEPCPDSFLKGKRFRCPQTARNTAYVYAERKGGRLAVGCDS